MATSLSTNTTVNSEKIELSLSIVGATGTNSGKTVASPDGACNTPTSTPDGNSPVTTDFDAPTSDEETSGTEDSDSSDSSVEQSEEVRTDAEANKHSIDLEEDPLVLQIINEIRSCGLQPRGPSQPPVATTRAKLPQKRPTDNNKKTVKQSNSKSGETKNQEKAAGKK